MYTRARNTSRVDREMNSIRRIKLLECSRHSAAIYRWIELLRNCCWTCGTCYSIFCKICAGIRDNQWHPRDRPFIYVFILQGNYIPEHIADQIACVWPVARLIYLRLRERFTMRPRAKSPTRINNDVTALYRQRQDSLSNISGNRCIYQFNFICLSSIQTRESKIQDYEKARMGSYILLFLSYFERMLWLIRKEYSLFL